MHMQPSTSKRYSVYRDIFNTVNYSSVSAKGLGVISNARSSFRDFYPCWPQTSRAYKLFLPYFLFLFFSGAYKFRDLYEAGDSSHMKSLKLLSSKINFDDPCNIQFTSVGISWPPLSFIFSFCFHQSFNLCLTGLLILLLSLHHWHISVSKIFLLSVTL